MNISTEELAAMIPSETVRQFVIDTDYQFDDWDRASIIYHAIRILDERYFWLKNLKDITEDHVLKKQITDYITSESEAYKLFKENPNHDFIYSVKATDQDCLDEGDSFSDYDVGELFFDFDVAFKFGNSVGECVEIEKHRILTTAIPKDNRQYEAVAEFKNSQLIRLCSYEMEGFDTEDNTLFMNRCYEVPNPFKRSDIVKDIKSGRCGVIELSQEKWDEVVEPDEEDAPTGHKDCCMRMVAIVPNEDIEYPTFLIANPLYLERYAADHDDSGDKVDYHFGRILQSTSGIYKGDDSAYNFFHHYREYREALKRREYSQ